MSKPCVFLLPGMLCDEAVFAAQREALSADYEVRVPVLRGFDSFEAMARAVLAQAPARFSLAGHSMGGRVALEVLRLAGPRVERVALMDFGAHPVAEAEQRTRQTWLALAEREGLPPVVEQLLPTMLHPALQNGPVAEAVRAMMLRHSVTDFQEQILASLRCRDQRQGLRDIEQSVLILVGADDAWSTVAQHRALLPLFPRARLQVVPEAGHMISMEQPARVNQLLLTWLRDELEARNHPRQLSKHLSSHRQQDYSMTKSPVAFLGLGTMGFPMAGHLARHGHSVCVYNRSPEKAQSWLAQYSGRQAPTPREAANGSAIVFACVGNDDDVRAVTLGKDGAFAGMAPGAVFIDHTTTSAELARELSAKAAELGLAYLDAPVSGGQAGAENGKLTVMIGGDEAAWDKCRAAIDCFAAKQALMGPSGYGQLSKMVNQICIAGLVQGLSEGLHFARRAELDIDKLIDVISKGAAQSWQMENRYQTMDQGKFDFGFAVDWMRKDLGIALDEAARNGSSLPVTRLVDGYYAEVQEMGGGRWDTSSLIARLQKPTQKST